LRVSNATVSVAAHVFGTQVFNETIPEHLVGAVLNASIPVVIPQHLVGANWTLSAHIVGTPIWNVTIPQHVFGNSTSEASKLVSNVSTTVPVSTTKIPLAFNLFGETTTMGFDSLIADRDLM